MLKAPKRSIFSLVIAAVFLCAGSVAFADSYNSTNYRIDESFIGGGGLIQSNSANYSGSDSIGSPAVGGSASTNYQTDSGYTTTSDPALSLIITSATVNFGAFSTASTKTGTSTFSVLNYTTYGYVAYIVGSPPSNGSHTLAGMSSTAASSTGTEQFGINLVANTAPATFGANPVQVPSGSFSFGSAASNYNTTNMYRYVAGETIAQATKNSGETDYTISYIVNVSTSTAGGSYSGDQQIIVIGTY